MKTTTIFLFALAWMAINGAAQEAIVPAGDYHQGGNRSISWTLGEVATETLYAGDYILTQGFQQPLLLVTSVDETDDTDFSVTVYPNPTADVLHINTDLQLHDNARYEIYTLAGSLLAEGSLEHAVHPVSFRNLEAGMYILRVSVGSDVVRTFRVVKR